MPEASKAFPGVTLTITPDPLSRRDELVIAAHVTDPADGQTYAFQGHATARGRDDFQVREILAVSRGVLEATTRRAMSIRRGPEAPPGEPPPDPDPPSPELISLRAEVARLRIVAQAAIDGWAKLAELHPEDAPRPKYPDGFRSPLDKSPASNVPEPGEDVRGWACPPGLTPIDELRADLVEATGPDAWRELRALVGNYRNRCNAEGALNMESYPTTAQVARVEVPLERCQLRLLDALGVPRPRPKVQTLPPTLHYIAPADR